MKTRLLPFFLIVACFAGQQVFSQPFTNRGKEFWVGYGHHQYMEPGCSGTGGQENTQNMVLYFSAEQAAVVTVTIDSSGVGGVMTTWWRRTYTIPANTVISTDILAEGGTAATSWTTIAGSNGPMPKGAPGYDSRLITDPPPAGTGGMGLFRKKGIHIESNVPIVAYAHIYGSVSSGATMLMPTHTWGYSYTSVNSQQTNADRSYSWMYVVAKEDFTRVQITPSQQTRLAAIGAGQTITVNLMKGQIYQVIGQSDCPTGNGVQLTGTTVVSIPGSDGNCHPIAVFAGSSRTAGEAALCGSAGRDNDMQQLFPEQSWGHRYLTAPFSRSSNPAQANQFQSHVYKVVVKDPNTVVRVNGIQISGLIGGKYYQFLSGTADYIEADKPVMVAQFMGGQGTACNGGTGDPEMVILSPVEQASKRVGFFRNNQEAIQVNYVTLVVPTPGLPSLRIDNSPTFSHSYAHPNKAGYTIVVKGWAADPQQCIITCDSGFNAITYGLGGAESYAYNAGTNIINLNGISSIHNVLDSTKNVSDFTCRKTPVQLSALIIYQPTQMVWKLSTLGAAVTPNADVTVNNPVPVGTVTINGSVYYKYTLPGTYMFNVVGSNYIPVMATTPTVSSCTRTEELTLEVVVRESPVTDFTYDQLSGCSNRVCFTGPTTAAVGFTSKHWRWSFPSGATDSTKTPCVDFPSSGNYNVYHKIITDEGCVGDTIKTVTVVSATVNPLTVSGPVSICEGESTTLTVSGGTTYTWTPATGLNVSSGSTVIANPTVTTTYTVSSDVSGCTYSRTITVTVNPKPAPPTVTSPATVCQGDNFVLNATATTGNTLTWYTSAALTGGSATPPTVSTAAPGSTTYWVTQKTPANCESNAATIVVTVQGQIGNNNNVGPAQVICSGTVPNAISSPSAPTGGNGIYTYQWEQSTDGGTTWNQISGATSSVYNPPSSTGTTKYRRIVTSGVCTNTSNVVEVTVQGSLTDVGISANQSICEGATPNQLIGQQPVGGDGTFAFQWESSPDNTNWSVVAGATAKDFQPPVLNTTIYYRRKVTSGICTGVSNVVTVTVNIKPTGTISGLAAACTYDPYSVNFTATSGPAPYILVLNVSGPGGYTNTVTQNISSNTTTSVPILSANSTAGNYTITYTSLTDGNNCTRTAFGSMNFVINARPTVTLSPNVAICAGGNTNLTASGADTYSWSPATGLSGTTGSVVVANPTVTTTYTVTGTTNGCNATAQVTVSVNPVPAKPVVVSPVTYCQGDAAAALSATASAGNSLTWYDNAALNGGTATPFTPSTVAAGTTLYYVTQTTPENCRSAAETISIVVQNAITGNTITADQTVCEGTLPASVTQSGSLNGGNGTFTNIWQQSADGGATWTNIPGATGGTYTPPGTVGVRKYRRIVNSGQCTSTSNVVTITVLAQLTNIGIGSNQTICESSPTALLVGQTPTGGDNTYSYQWQSSTDLATWTNIAGANSKDYQPGILSVNTYFRRITTSGPCTATSAHVLITVRARPDGSLTGSAVCEYEAASVSFTASAGAAPYSVQLSVTGPGGYNNVVTQTVSTTTATIPVLPANSTPGSYNVIISSITDNNGCIRGGGFTSVSITVTARPTLTISPNVAICQGASTTLTVSGATNYTWSPSTGLNTTTGSSVVANPTATISYTVTGTTNGCSNSGSVTVTVNVVPAKPTVTSPVSYCQGSPSIALTATASAGNTLTWYDNAGLTGGSTTAPTPSTAAAGSTTYYVTQTSPQNCRSAAETITVVVQASVTGNTITADQTVCQGTIPGAISGGTLSGGTGTFTYSWSQSTDGGATWTTVGGATSASLTPSATPGVTQYRRVVSSGLCNSTSNVVTVTVSPQLTNTSVSAAQTICEGSAPASLTGQLPTGGNGTYTYQWQSSDDGSTWVLIAGATSKDYQPPVLTANTHYRRIVTSGPCTAISAPVMITVKPTANGNITGATVCEYDPASVTFTATAGTAPYSIQLSMSGPGGYTNTITQSVGATATIPVLPANSAAGSYTVTIASLSDVNSCVRTTGFATATITVNPKPVLTVSPNAAICAGGNTTLTASGATTYSWSPASGLSSTTGSSVTANPTVTTTYTVTGTTSGCNSTAQVTVTVNPVPAKPTVTSPVTYCQGSTAVALSATASAGNTLTWYDNPGLTGGSTTAPVPSTATPGTFNYYVTQTNGFSCTSQAETITVVVQPSISNNSISADQLLCSGASAAPIGSATPPTGGSGSYAYQWQQSTDGGAVWTLISGATSLSYSPGVLSATTQYRRLVASGLCNSISNVVTVAVQGAVSNTGITANQTICSGSTPAMLDGQPAGSVTYQWEISSDNIAWTNISGAISEDYQPDALISTRYYRRKVSNGACSSVSNTVTITVNVLPNGAITGSTKCEYEAADITFASSAGTAPFALVLNVTGPGGYSAALTRNNVPSTATIPVLPANSAPGTYTVAFATITDNNGCARTGLPSATINITARPVLSIPATVPACQGTSTTLTVSGATSYTWSPATGLSSTTGSTVTANPASTTTYTVTGTANGCFSSAPVTVTVNPRPNASFTVDNNVCEESQATFVPATTSSNVTSWKWDFGDGTGVQTYTDGNSFTRPYTTASTFNIKMVTVDANGCVSDTARQSITVRPKPSADFTLPTSICLPNGVANFRNVSAVSGNGTLTYVWDLGDQSPAVTTKDVSHVYAANGPYNVTLTATSAYGCKDIESKLLNSDVFFSKPVAKFSVAPEALCQGMDNVFTDESNAPNSTITSWRWNFDDGTAISTKRNPTRRYKNPGTYEVALVVTNAVGCVSDTAKKEVIVFLQPVIDAGPSFVVTVGTEVTFKPRVNDTSLSFTWTPSADFADPSKLSQTLVAFKDQTYTLAAEGEGGCTATDTLVIKILNAIKIPNAFSPNGDGTNDTWEIPYLKDYPGATVHIYNRFGQQVFTSYGYGRPWDGNYKGKPLPVATYYYVIVLKNGFAPVSGSVTIVK